MKTYEFIFRDGQRLTGEGEGPAEALLNAYHLNGFLPLTNIIERLVLSDDSRPAPPEPPPLDSDTSGREAKRRGKRG